MKLENTDLAERLRSAMAISPSSKEAASAFRSREFFLGGVELRRRQLLCSGFVWYDAFLNLLVVPSCTRKHIVYNK